MHEFYSIPQPSEITDQTFSVAVILNASHRVYKGHFPEIPVAPGACLTQMIRRILSDTLEIPLLLRSADNIKFLQPIIPTTKNEFTLDITFSEQNKVIACTANLRDGSSTYLKFKGHFVRKSEGATA